MLSLTQRESESRERESKVRLWECVECKHTYKELNVEVADEALLLNEVEQKLRERLKVMKKKK